MYRLDSRGDLFAADHAVRAVQCEGQRWNVWHRAFSLVATGLVGLTLTVSRKWADSAARDGRLPPPIHMPAELFEAIGQHDGDRVRALLRAGASPNDSAPGVPYWKPLEAAIEEMESGG